MTFCLFIILHSKAETEMATVLQTTFLHKFPYVNHISLTISFHVPNLQNPNIGSDDDLAPKRLQVII